VTEDKLERISLDEIKKLDIVEYLADLGFQPSAVKKNGADHWYLSPLRTECEASFKVNQTKNRWFDKHPCLLPNLYSLIIRFVIGEEVL